MATREQLQRALINADRAGDTEAAKVLATQLRATANVPQGPKPQDSVAKRIGMGALEAGLGVVQLASRPVGAFGRMVGSEYLARSPQAVDETVRDLSAAQEAGAPEGFDWARLGGNVAAFGPAVAARAPAALSRVLSSGRPLVQAAKTGAAAGGAGGAVMPTTSEDYATAKVGQVAGGVVGGTVLGPLASKAGELVGRALRAGIDILRPQANITVTVESVLRAGGIDPATASREFYQEVAEQVANAQRTGGAVNQEALQIGGAADRLDVRPLMTRGQIERDPTQFGQEEFLRNAPGGNRLAQNVNEVQAQLQQRLGGMQRSAGTALDAPAAGARVMQPLQVAEQRGTQLNNRLYELAESAPGNPQFIGSRGVVDDVTEALRVQRLDRNIPAGARAILEEASSGRYSVRSASRDLQNLNRMIRENEGKPEGVAAQIIKDRLDRGLAASLTDADVAYRTARTAAAQKFQIEEAIPALNAIKAGTATPDTFMQRFVFGPQATVESVREMRRFLLRADPEAWGQVKAQSVDSLRAAAGYSENAAASKFNSVAFDKALNSLKKTGKIGVLFDGAEVQMLNDIARVARAVGERPAGLSGTGLAGAARLAGMFGKLMERISTVPGISQTVGAASTVAMPGVRFAQAGNALRTPAYATAGRVATPYRNALAAGAGVGIVPAFEN